MKEGIYKNVTSEEYHGDQEYVSASRVKEALSSIHNYAKYKPTEAKSHFEVGHAFETYLCEKSKFNSKIVTLDWDERPNPKAKMGKANQDWLDEKMVYGRSVQKHTITSMDLVSIHEMYKRVKEYPEIMKLLKLGVFQYSIFWTDENGVKVKTRPDWVIHVNDKQVINIDIKSTRHTTVRDFIWDIRKLNYPLQNVMQVKGLEAMGYEVVNSFWLGVSKAKGGFVKLIPFENDQIEIMKGIYDKTSKSIKSYIDNGIQKEEFSIERIDLTEYFNHVTR